MKRKPDFPNFVPVADISEADRLLTTHDVARLLAVSRETLKGWRSRNRRAGIGPQFVRIGGLAKKAGRVRYSLREVERYIRERTVGTSRAESEAS